LTFPPREEQAEVNSETIKVLLIDEDEDDYIQTCELFSLVKVGRYAVEWASSYEEGLTVAGRREHHVCLVDYRLGERSGVELIREARQSRLSTPMILFTGQGDHDLDVEAMEAGATDYLIKDETSPARLERTIRYAVQLNIERCRAEEELGAYAEKQTVVAEIGRLALTGGELEDLFDQAVSLVARTLGVEYCKILELLPESDAFILRAGVGWKEEYPSGQAAFSVGKESQAGFTLLSDEPVVVEDMRTETRFSGPTLPHEHEVVSGMSVTIRGLERPYGVLGAHSASVRRFATDDVSFLRAVANVLAEAIDRKRAEVSLRQSESQFRALFENALDAVLIADDGGAYVDANPAACSLLGVSYDEVIGRTISDFTEQDAKAETPRIWEQFLKEGTMCGVFALRRPDGKLVEVDFSATANFLPGRHLSILRDVTERKQAAEAVERSERLLRELAEELESERKRLVEAQTLAKLGSWHIDLSTMAMIWSAETHRIFETDPAKFNPDHEGFLQFVHPDDRAAVNQAFALSLGRCSEGETEHRVLMPDGRIKFLEERWRVFHDEHQKPVRAVGACMDITEQVLSRRRLQETEDQLRQSQKLESVGMLAGGIAHDFNNLLTVITGYSELTLKGLDKADPLVHNVEEIKTAAERAASLTRQLLAFSRKQVLQPKVLDLNSIILNIEKMLGRLVGEDMELRSLPGVGLGQVKADPGQIEQVVLNLVVNARDAMPNGGKITLETANIHLDEAYARRHIAVQPGWYAMLAVTDTGHGMDAKTQKYIFEPFFTTKEQGKGTGLGLSTVYGIVKQSGGNIWVYSEVGVGTSFKIYLPLVDEHVTGPEAGPGRPEGALGTETILVAEDEEMVRHLARESLMKNGYTVLEAADGGEALLIAQQHQGPIHLLLTDVVMPRMSGKELAEQVVKLRPDTRVLYMSGYTDQAIVHHGILDRDIAFIGKPFTPNALVLKIVAVLQQNLSSSPGKANSVTRRK